MRCLFFILFLSALSISHAQQKNNPRRRLHVSSDSIRTGTFWYWISDNISKEGAIADLHAMKKAGINLAFIGNIGPSYHSSSNHPYGKVKFMSEEWWQVMHAALKTATEL
ncbi:MAG: glycosyl hydrolase [Bacteroides thetaiotaomicron]